jgi:maltooligosyltrehalose synthase
MADGRLKLLLTARLLALRRAAPALFSHGTYLPLEVQGPAAGHVVAYARLHDSGTVIVIGTRLLAGLTQNDPAALTDGACWRGSTVSLPPSVTTQWRDWLTGRGIDLQHDSAPVLALDQMLAQWPMAVLAPAALQDPLAAP